MLFTKWKVKRTNLLRLLQVEGKTVYVYGAQEVLLEKTLDIIKKAEKFKGIAVEPEKFPNTRKNTISIVFGLLFPDEKNIEKFIMEILKE